MRDSVGFIVYIDLILLVDIDIDRHAKRTMFLYIYHTCTIPARRNRSNSDMPDRTQASPELHAIRHQPNHVSY